MLWPLDCFATLAMTVVTRQLLGVALRAMEKARKHLRRNFAEKSGKRPFGQEEVQAEAARRCLMRVSAHEVATKEKQRDPRLGIEYRAHLCN